jgi:leader peptidase (prepilin peptidase) / N-methyltransferase
VSGFVVIAAVVAGLAAGPFLRRLIDQVPGREPLFVRPNHELVPVASWFDTEPGGTRVLVGSPDDREDDTADSRVLRWRAPAIDLVAASVLAVLAARIGWTWALPAFLAFGASLVVVAAIDIDHYRIPDRILFPTLAVCVPILAFAAFVDGISGAFLAAVAGAAAYFAFLFVFFFVWPRGMGFGDVKLALVLGLHVGWAGAVVELDGEMVYRGFAYAMQLVLTGALIGSLLGAVLGIGVLIVFGRKGAFPFGPALCVGALLAVVLSEQFVN